MTHRAIIPRRVSRDSRVIWRVCVPKGIRPNVGQKTRDFSLKGDALNFARGLAGKRELLQKMREIRELLKEFADCPDFRLVTETAKLESAAAVRRLNSVTLDDAFRQVVESKKQSGKRANSIATLTCSLKSFAAACPKPAADVLPSDIEGWLYGNKLAPKTRKGRLTDIHTAFSWMVKRNMVASNPAAAVEPPKVPYKSAEIMAITDVSPLLRTCQKSDPALLGYLSLILFGGLRAKESARARPENVHDGIVDIGGEQTKLNVRRCFPIQPVLAAWLSVPGVEIGGKNIYSRFVELRKVAGVKIPDNGLRHTAASCWLELLGAKDAAKMLGHSEQTLFKHYASKVTAEDAQAFAEILP